MSLPKLVGPVMSHITISGDGFELKTGTGFVMVKTQLSVGDKLMDMVGDVMSCDAGAARHDTCTTRTLTPLHSTTRTYPNALRRRLYPIHLPHLHRAPRTAPSQTILIERGRCRPRCIAHRPATLLTTEGEGKAPGTPSSACARQCPADTINFPDPPSPSPKHPQPQLQ
jgi:hypothetical protein